MSARHRYRGFLILAALLLLWGPALVAAQQARSGSDSARAAQQLQQLAVEQAALKEQNAKLQQSADEMKKKADDALAAKKALEARVAALTADAGRAGTESQQNAQALEKSRAQMQELVARFRETAQNLKNVETERADLKNQLADKTRDFARCADKNIALYTAGNEILDHVEHRGLWSELGEKEPFTRIQRTRLENLIDEYRARIQEQQLPQSKAPKSGT
jgi:chaperonin cofactor prefoldin